MRAIEAVGVDADGIVVLRRDRLARALINACAIEALVEKSGGAVLCVDGTGNGNLPTDRLIRQIVDSFAEYERAMISLRIRDAFARKREQGERLGKVPFGYRVCDAPGRKSHSGRAVGLEPDPGEQEVIARIHAAKAKGMSLRSIVESLNAQGVPARGKCWHLSSVVRILKLPPPGVERPA
jgi:DNA invertase Pin-like site-specific DNA recombinase